MSKLPDPIREGLQRGWKVRGGPHGAVPQTLSCDVAIIGSGAGAGITAELLARAGLSVVIVEEGPLRSSSDFRQRESEAYPQLYQESASRKTEDKAISILQGRCVGGSTTVNWTSSFRTPTSTLGYWAQHFGLKDYNEQALEPYFEQAERRLNVSSWQMPPNENNELLRAGAVKLGIPVESIRRNVQGCWNLGSCGMGCPTNAKQSMLVTTLPVALEQGATLLVQTRAERLEMASGKVQALHCVGVQLNSTVAGDAVRTRITARHYVLSGGAINSPAVLLRSQAPDPHGRLGLRTFLHPVVMTAAVMEQRVAGWAGAPQSLCTDHFLETQAIDGPMGFKIEAPPLHPLILATTMPGMGQPQADLLRQFPHTHVLLALLRDGFHDQAQGGRVKLRGDGSALLNYPLTDFVMEGARRAMLAMAEIQFAAGAQKVLPVHEMGELYSTWAQAKAAIAALPMKPLLTRVVSAHVMGGCGLAGDERLGVVRPDGVHWQVENLSVHDGSLFPTSVGANPQLSIYGIVNRLAQGLVQRLTGQSQAQPLA
jgi:choline dehydrogenase-like flavoprotein